MQKKNFDFNSALSLCNKKFSHNDLIEFLKLGNVVERQFAALSLESIENEDEADVFLSNLVGVDGKIREAIALKLSELTQKTPQLFCHGKNAKIFSDATIDIDGNVCRLAIESAKNLSISEDFSKLYTENLLNIVKTALNEISKFTFRDKKYKINKQVFKIYWCLEALAFFYKYLDSDILIDLLTSCSSLSEYTIREKCANILKKIGQNNINKELFDKLRQDENYYVRNSINN